MRTSRLRNHKGWQFAPDPLTNLLTFPRGNRIHSLLSELWDS